MAISWVFSILLWGLKGAPGVTNGWCTTPEGWRAGTNQNNSTYHGFKVAFLSLPMKKIATANLDILVRYLFALRLWGGSLGWHATLERVMGKYQNDKIFDGFKGAHPLFTHKKDSKGKSIYLGRIFGCFWALRAAPGVTDGWFATMGWWGRKNQNDLTFDGFKWAVPSLSTKKVTRKTNRQTHWERHRLTDRHRQTLSSGRGRLTRYLPHLNESFVLLPNSMR